MPYYEVVFNKPLNSYTYFSEEENLIYRRVNVSLSKESDQLSLVSRNKTTVAFVIAVQKPDENITYKKIESIIDSEAILNKEDIALAKWISNYYLCSLGEAIALFISFSQIKKTKKKEVIEQLSDLKKIQLNTEQQKIAENIFSSNNNFHYLHGVTGSGKTFVYLKVIDFFLQQKKSTLFLVPEINLIDQNIHLLKEYFGKEVAIYHGSLTPLQKERIKKDFKNGIIKIIIGTRSAFFLNSPHLKLIITDEEQESSYKNESTPRYQIKTIAQQKAKIQNLKIIFGSATPSIEIFYHTKKKIDYHFLKNRFYDVELPEVEVVKSDQKNIFNNEVIKKITKVLKQKKQILVFYNQRGFAKSIFCQDCQVVLSCPNCSLTLHYHKSKKKLLCHYCDYQSIFYSKCIHCRKDNLSLIGMGIEKVKEELEKKFLMSNIGRLDSDIASDYKKVNNILQQIKNQEIDIIVGTQMICKGHHFPNIGMVIILQPENILNIPDFRSNERFFSQIVQVAGRAGRSNDHGKVIIQTLSVNHPLIEFGKNHDYKKFYDREIQFRHQFNYPPFLKMVRIIARGKKEQEVKDSITQVFEKINDYKKNKKSNSIIMYPPSPCLIQKINLNYRWHILLKSKKFKLMINVLTLVKRDLKTKAYLEYDVDPTELF